MDVYGNALKDFHFKQIKKDLTVHCSHTEEEVMDVSYFFRQFSQMPEIEHKALSLCQGSVLDVGAAAGCHAIELEKKGLNVTAIDISEGAVAVLNDRLTGSTVLQKDFFELSGVKYDTILMMMNGLGMVGTVDKLHRFFMHVNLLLAEGGQVILDSSDIIYLFEDEDGGQWIDLNASYYGELKYRFEYDGLLGNEFNWLFLDVKTLIETSSKYGFNCQVIQEGEHYDYLARLTRK